MRSLLLILVFKIFFRNLSPPPRDGASCTFYGWGSTAYDENFSLYLLKASYQTINNAMVCPPMNRLTFCAGKEGAAPCSVSSR